MTSMTPARWPVADERELELLREVLASERWGGYHEFVARFESQFAAYQQCAWGVAAMNGTVTLEMALEAAGVSPGAEVIVPAISFISTATAVSRVGATPVFVDIEPLSFNLDPERAAAAVTPRTRAILVVHFGGLMADMDRLLELAGSRGLVLIEDAAHAHGAEWKRKRAGSFGLAGSFSFQNSKIMTAGEGGILVGQDPELAARARSIADQGRRPGGGWFHHYTLGTNYRMTAWQAAILIAQLERLPGQIEQRARNAARLREQVATVAGLSWQQICPQITAHSWYLLLGCIDAATFGMSRDEFQRALTAAGVPCTPFYPHPLYDNPLYRQGGCRIEPCPVAEQRIGDAFWLPHRVLLGGEDEIQWIASTITSLAHGGGR